MYPIPSGLRESTAPTLGFFVLHTWAKESSTALLEDDDQPQCYTTRCSLLLAAGLAASAASRMQLALCLRHQKVHIKCILLHQVGSYCCSVQESIIPLNNPCVIVMKYEVDYQTTKDTRSLRKPTLVSLFLGGVPLIKCRHGGRLSRTLPVSALR
ncbi:MAG: hypothetical protein FE78DRAFT_254180 [Acidomyces sp. 'richmondensis']|nr:MAG: hypothetical protein FE78DRAFT_254180 [Acidomyces sp. 'richmondensis']